MTAIAIFRTPALTRLRARVSTGSALAVGSLSVVALHVADDKFLQPNPGTSAGDHLVGRARPDRAARPRPRGPTHACAPAPAPCSRSCSAFFALIVGRPRPPTTRSRRPVGRRLHRPARSRPGSCCSASAP